MGKRWQHKVSTRSDSFPCSHRDPCTTASALTPCWTPHPRGETGGAKSPQLQTQPLSPCCDPRPGWRGEGRHRCGRGPGSRRRPSLQTCECCHASEWSCCLKSRLRSAAGRLLSGCQRRPEQRHLQQSFTRRASVWGEGRERDRHRTHTLGCARGETSRLPPALIPMLIFFPFLLFFFCFWKNKDFGVGWRCCFSGVAVGGRGEAGGGGGNRWLECKKVPNFPGRVAEIVCAKLRGGKTGGGGNN